ncbi:MAG: bifunctional demethylmenaquinone methyltransferase/2-methoxy-6-polyprenyl-1,4-benzoquinol methylase UbiE [Muribaculaceae bacterium]|nr:bifunctional demethylmenaquinone methyltransferase/2-methoxy-6-polyprenyl-1,4-benzoquinol methylase UbiE [Muribaculaceae bacterium]
MAEKSGAENINPYDDTREKGVQVEQMFDSIAPAYDFMNTAMTFGLHRRWRDKAIKSALKLVAEVEAPKILDVATGTGDVAFRLHELLPQAIVTGIDLSSGMLDVARKKLAAMPETTGQRLSFGKADCLALPFHDREFDMITVAYGVRNFENLLIGLKEMRRVMKEGGVLCIVELSCPTGTLTRLGYRIYTRHIIPNVGRMVSGDSRAYTYLPESIAAAPQREKMGEILKKAGFNDVTWKSLTFGAVTYYLAR